MRVALRTRHERVRVGSGGGHASSDVCNVSGVFWARLSSRTHRVVVHTTAFLLRPLLPNLQSTKLIERARAAVGPDRVASPGSGPNTVDGYVAVAVVGACFSSNQTHTFVFVCDL